MFALKIFRGTHDPVWVCASKRWSISSACKNLMDQHPVRAETTLANSNRITPSVGVIKILRLSAITSTVSEINGSR